MTQTNHDPPRVIKDPHETVHSKRTRVKRRPLKQDVSKQQWVINWNTTIKATITFQQCSSRRRDGGVGLVSGGGGGLEKGWRIEQSLYCASVSWHRSVGTPVRPTVPSRWRLSAISCRPHGGGSGLMARHTPRSLARHRLIYSDLVQIASVSVSFTASLLSFYPRISYEPPDPFCPKGRR